MNENSQKAGRYGHEQSTPRRMARCLGSDLTDQGPASPAGRSLLPGIDQPFCLLLELNAD